MDSTIQAGSGYISMGVESSSAQRIFDAISGLGITGLQIQEKYHFTLFYDKSNPIIESPPLPKDTIFSAKLTGAKILSPGTPLAALALIFDSPELDKRFEELQSLGLTYDFPEFIAHCTIKYLPEDDDFKLLEEHIGSLTDTIGSIELVNEKWRKAKN